jgi:HPt (histidine-containing phosphotransfer) domain-containing protein
LPANIEGLDLRAGLRRVAGMRALYVKILGSFVDQQSDIGERLRLSIADCHMDQAAREIHTFRGLASTIEAIELRNLSLGIETALAAGDIAVALALLDRLETALRPLISSIKAAI